MLLWLETLQETIDYSLCQALAVTVLMMTAIGVLVHSEAWAMLALIVHQRLVQLRISIFKVLRSSDLAFAPLQDRLRLTSWLINLETVLMWLLSPGLCLLALQVTICMLITLLLLVIPSAESWLH